MKRWTGKGILFVMLAALPLAAGAQKQVQECQFNVQGATPSGDSRYEIHASYTVNQKNQIDQIYAVGHVTVGQRVYTLNLRDPLGVPEGFLGDVQFPRENLILGLGDDKSKVSFIQTLGADLTHLTGTEAACQ